MKTEKISVSDININFDFSTDCRYWNDFWTRNNGLGSGETDPDSMSATLRQYHQALWSKPLPNGRPFALDFEGSSDYLRFGNIRLSSDSITTEFRYNNYRYMIETVESQMPDYKKWMEQVIRNGYTIGGMIIFPSHRNSINGMRGVNKFICDRWDLTLECIKRYYDGVVDSKENPLGWVLENDKSFFDLFCDFKGYVDFFFLQDCVSDDYSSVKMWIPTVPFEKTNPLPSSVDEYMKWVEETKSFLKKRNNRILNYIKSKTI